MRKRSILLVAGAVALVASLVIGPSATAKSERAAAGTVIFGHDQEPATLNPFITAGSNYPTPLTMNPVLASGGIYNNKAVLIPQLWDGNPKILKNDPLTVTFKYKKTAVWSDGQPVTGQDFFDTWKVIMNPNFDITAREGWEDIQSVKAKGKSVTVAWKKGKPYAGWDVIVGTQLMPRQQVGSIMNSSNGTDFNNLWLNNMPLSSGPFKFTSWTKGTQLVISKNPKYKGAGGPISKLNQIVFRFIPSTPSEFQALQAGEIDVMEPQPQLQIADINKNPKFKVEATVGYQWQHLDIQRGPKGAPALKKAYVRQALVQGINRAQIKNALFVSTGIVKSAKDLPVLQSNIFKPFEAQYKPWWAKWKFSQKNVIALLKKNGCTGGPDKPSSSNSNIWSCPGVGKLSFRFTTTSGNQLRALAFEIMQKQLKSVGIELVPRFGPNTVVFGQVLPSGDWDLFLFTWLITPVSEATSASLYSCSGVQPAGQNYMNYCNKKASALLDKAQHTPDPAKRNPMLNAAEKIMASDVDSIPMWAPPYYLIGAKKVKGLLVNPTLQGSTWNAESWAVSG
jgi:peptide/nickel transport system substrate-binding protein